MVSWLTRRRYYTLSMAMLVLVAAVYLGRLGMQGNLGFPLDDAWIHQTYARNLALHHQFAYLPGTLSAGSTAPLWTVLLAPAYWMGIDPLVWSYTAGLVLLFFLGLGVFCLAERLFPGRSTHAALAGLVVVLEWHMAWAALSGMETILFSCGVVWLLERYVAWETVQRREEGRSAHPFQAPFVLGVMGGALVWIRPEGLLLVALLALAGVLVRWRRSWRLTFGIAVDVAAGMAMLLIPYIVFNLMTGGTLFPNTFYAKQAEYVELFQVPLWTRLWNVFRPTIVGAQVVLLPGVGYVLWQVLRRKRGALITPYLSRYTLLVPFLWWALTLLVYALRLPVDYQHGRYVMPTIPVMVLLGVSGTLAWVRPRARRLWVRVIGRAVPWTVFLLLALFLVLGGQAFATDVGIINGEMVAVAHWLNEYTPVDAVIAAHDIGAIGYFARRPLLDMAGLVTPDVIPFIRDEPRLLRFLIEQEADYLVTFPSWYRAITADERLVKVFETDCALTRQQGSDNMAVYQVRRE